jgi:hypothetical protein
MSNRASNVLALLVVYTAALETIRHLIGCPDPAGHALFKRFTLEFRKLTNHTVQ